MQKLRLDSIYLTEYDGFVCKDLWRTDDIEAIFLFLKKPECFRSSCIVPAPGACNGPGLFFFGRDANDASCVFVLEPGRMFPDLQGLGDVRLQRTWLARKDRPLQCAGIFRDRSDWSGYILRTDSRRDCRGWCECPVHSVWLRSAGRIFRLRSPDRSGGSKEPVPDPLQTWFLPSGNRRAERIRRLRARIFHSCRVGLPVPDWWNNTHP